MNVLIAGPCELASLEDHLARDPQPLPTGLPGTSVRTILDELLAKGHRVTLVTLDPTITQPVRREGERLRLLVGPSRRRGRARDLFRVERDYVKEAITSERPDVVHAQWTYEFALGALDSGSPTLVTVRDWGPAILRFHKHPYRVVRLAMQLETFRRRPPMTTVSPYMQRRIERLTRTAVALVPNAIRDEVFSAEAPSQENRPPLIVSVNQGWSAYKNVSSLLEAFQLVQHHVPDARLALVGVEYGAGEAAQRWAAQRGLDRNVDFIGRVPYGEVVRWIRQATVFVHPSREESFGLVVAEAMANHVPVVGGRASGGVPWVLDHGLAGVLCDVRDPADLGAAVRGLLENPQDRRILAERGFLRADRNFRISSVADQYLRLYEATAG